MSSYREIAKRCQHCGNPFIAKKGSTKFCSLCCARKNYKLRMRLARTDEPQDQLEKRLFPVEIKEKDVLAGPDLIDIKQLSFATSIPQRTLYRLMLEPGFPRLKIGKKLLFNKSRVLEYLERVYGKS